MLDYYTENNLMQYVVYSQEKIQACNFKQWLFELPL